MTTRVEHRTVDYVAEVSQLLWPHDPDGPGRSVVALPSRSRPRMLVPAGPPRVAAAAVRTLAADRSLRGRVRRDGVAVALLLGAGRLLRTTGRARTVGAGGLDAHLSAALGRPVVSAMLVGPPRANRKPVLALLDTRGRAVGFAKVGTGPLTRHLVTREARALELLATRASDVLDAPRLLHRVQWRGAEVAVQSPLATSRATTPGEALLQRAFAAVAATSPHAGTALPLEQHEGWRATRRALAEHGGAAGEEMLDLAGRLERHAASTPVPVGAWHGDLTPWNLGEVGGRVLVWDWERYEDGVPVGFDALHHELAVLTQVRGLPHEEAARRLVERSVAVTAPLGVPEQAAASVALAHLLTVGTRYLVDDQAAAGHRSGRLDRWLVPLLRAHLV